MARHLEEKKGSWGRGRSSNRCWILGGSRGNQKKDGEGKISVNCTRSTIEACYVYRVLHAGELKLVKNSVYVYLKRLVVATLIWLTSPRWMDSWSFSNYDHANYCLKQFTFEWVSSLEFYGGRALTIASYTTRLNYWINSSNIIHTHVCMAMHVYIEKLFIVKFSIIIFIFTKILYLFLLKSIGNEDITSVFLRNYYRLFQSEVSFWIARYFGSCHNKRCHFLTDDN